MSINRVIYKYFRSYYRCQKKKRQAPTLEEKKTPSKVILSATVNREVGQMRGGDYMIHVSLILLTYLIGLRREGASIEVSP